MERSLNSRSRGVSLKIFWLVTVISFALIIGLGVFAFSLKKDVNELEEKVISSVDESVEDTDKDDKPLDTNTAGKCSKLTGKYYGEVINDSVVMKQTYTFKDDGSYTVMVENGGGNSGMYIVAGSNIYLFQNAGTGPSSEINGFYYSIEDDCKTLYGYYEGSEYKLSKVDA